MGFWDVLSDFVLAPVKIAASIVTGKNQFYLGGGENLGMNKTPAAVFNSTGQKKYGNYPLYDALQHQDAYMAGLRFADMNAYYQRQGGPAPLSINEMLKENLTGQNPTHQGYDGSGINPFTNGTQETRRYSHPLRI
ncbi:MAG: hypothetical protein U0003_03865 [Vampirovibrionales bacterium]